MRQNPIANPENFQLEEEEITIWVGLENLNDSDCFDITDFEITTTMSVSSFENYTKIWPNPVSDILYVENTKEPITGLTLYDLQGRIIKQTNAKELNVTELSSGVYFVEVKGSTSAYIKRVIVE